MLVSLLARQSTSVQPSRHAPAHTRRSMPRPVVTIAGLTVVVLLLFSGGYGFHRDELYFIVAGRHPDWGYVDQPPLTPILSAAAVAILGLSPTAIRILPALVVGASILLTAAMARDMGGDQRARWVAALAVALSGLLLAGHLASTATYELLAVAVITWLVVRILRGDDVRLWIAVGLVGGLALLNKYTIGLTVVALVAGILIARRWSILRSRWPWLGAAVALVVAAPGLAWQATHGFPQLEMARHIAAAVGDAERTQLLPLQLVLAGPLLWPVVIVGLWWLLRAPDARPWRALAWAYAVALALTYWQGGKAYYVAGFIPVLFAAGSVPVAAWLSRGRLALRRTVFAAAAVASGAAMVVVALPVLPPPLFASSGINDVNKESGEQIGWPELVAQVQDVTARLTPDERAHAVIITASYGEAGALELLGRDHPPVFSGQNSYWDFGRPAEGTRVVVVVGRARTSGLSDCRSEGRVDNGIGLRNEEQGVPIQVCRGMPGSWAEVWPAYRHLD